MNKAEGEYGDLMMESQRALQTTTSQALSYVILGLSLAAALAWVEASRDFIKSWVKIPRDVAGYQVLHALLLTLLAVLAYQFLSRLVPGISRMPIIGVVG